MAQTGKSAPAKKKPAAKSPVKKPAAKKPAAKKAASQKQAAEQLAMHRCVLAGVLLLISFVGVLSMFGAGGFVIRWYQAAFGWLLG